MVCYMLQQSKSNTDRDRIPNKSQAVDDKRRGSDQQHATWVNVDRGTPLKERVLEFSVLAAFGSAGNLWNGEALCSED